MAHQVLFHIGLPKTATSFLQHRIFRSACDIKLVHRAVEPDQKRNAELCLLLKTIVSDPNEPDATRYSELRTLLSSASSATNDAKKVLIISDENISMSSNGFWDGTGNGPELVAERLALVMELLDVEGAKPKILLGTREVGGWLASRYAQSAKNWLASKEGKSSGSNNNIYSQSDFDTRLEDLITSKNRRPVHSWIDNNSVSQAFERHFDVDQVAFINQEKLSKQPNKTLDRLTGFIGCDSLSEIYKTNKSKKEGPNMRPNVLFTKSGGGGWRMGDEVLFVDPELRHKLHERFGAEALDHIP